ncbi:uncharacterized protein LOC128183281 [Crassostrea angulata]|uniref:uncharacterized protein LOC128183281 n=1 Tax=Magallana angulata TaxID=2784310 RepID=UPI0022B0847F|nr:uncharacterized protein LOC128183281 [Crassostrea angulata]XP_052708197.1 uncharacterized protein LOC128183281 [Crassostrea angulata]
MAVQNISESVYVGMCLKIGTPQQVASRRDIVDSKEMLINNEMLNNPITVMLSGSLGEGFRLSGSDMDYMHWPNNHRVIWDFSQVHFYNTQEHTLILCDSSESPPGFTLLWLPLEETSHMVMSACVRMNGMLCISSSMYREVTCSLVFPGSSPHGPCGSGSYGSLEYDTAHCFISDFWPPSASSWIDRCHSWPPPHVVNDIIRNGCHFVAIGHKLGNHTGNEWRISFSQAEYKLVCSMNHTQFLTYGLLKLFLKEIINEGLRDEDKLLCSYHMKTTVFWAIQQNALPRWCPQNLMDGFWVCFKLLLKWVYEGVCPNFFIPENNMFLSNIYGEAQKTLFTRLYRLYENGLALLLHSPSIRSYIINVLCNPRLVICTDEHTLISEVEVDENIFDEVYANDSIYTLDLHECEKNLHMVEQLLGLPLTQYHIVMLQKLTATILQRTAFTLHSMYTNTGSNKQLYIVDKVACRFVKLAAKFGFVSDMLYIAMYYYKSFRYRDALSVIDTIKVKLAQPYLMYDSHVDRERYTEAVGSQSLSTKMRQAVAQNIKIVDEIFYINALIPEQQSSKQNNVFILFIPPHVLLYMLEFLCSRHVDTMRAQRTLDDLQVLVHHDQGQLVPVHLRDISWEILGICQQITGNLQAALYSYQQSLRQDPHNRIQTATRQRIQDLHL